ncbi:MAG TPA: PDZ domain-containing protein, partial [Pyrinomonadaceae bacterium]|nr:PDZ domain-containing protein [Pyrinomonadaceae bacterium]
KAGLKKDDVILRFDGEAVTNVRKLNRLVNEASADQSVRLTISRGGAEQEVTATLSKRPGFDKVWGPTISSEVWKGLEKGDGQFVFSFGGNRRIGVSTQTLTKQLADYFGVKEGGTLITSVTENSPAAKAGLKAGDVITAIDGEKVDSSGDVSRAINRKQEGDVTLTVVRDRNSRTVTVTPEKNPNRQLIRPGTIGTIREQVRDSIRRGVLDSTIVLPRIEVSPVNIQVPRIVVPTPRIDVTVPTTPRVLRRARVVII